ncbi:MAG: cupredoxin domain-containing protein [Alphaproteobacteria bacterium]
MTRFIALLLLLLSTPAQAGDYELVLKDHEFTPAELKVKAGSAFVLTVRNEDSTPAAFESTMNTRPREIIEGNSALDIKIGPLKAGDYHVFDPFHIGAEGLVSAK